MAGLAPTKSTFPMTIPCHFVNLRHLNLEGIQKTDLNSLSFTVKGLPPKKDWANSMWNKGVEQPRLKALRVAAVEAMAGRPPLDGSLILRLVVHALPEEGDLDNFITGVCDGLMAAQRNTPIKDEDWVAVPVEAYGRSSSAPKHMTTNLRGGNARVREAIG